MANLLAKLLSAGEGKQLKKYRNQVARVNALEPEMQAKTDEELAAMTGILKERVAAGEKLQSILPEAFATVREAGVRRLGMRHFDVQLIGGMALNDGNIAEMRTGEGKTLVSTLAGYLNALTEKPVHIVTVNDYLARRDAETMSRLYNFLGMSVGLIQNNMLPSAKIPAYKADVTYGTNAEFGFDYLRDNMVTRADHRVQRGHYFAVVDEVDSILIDEARTPLIISGAGSQAAEDFKKFARVMPGLIEGDDFEKDEAKRTIHPTESGLVKIESLLGIEDIFADPSGQLANHLQQALRAQFLFHRNKDYIVVDGEVKIVDEFTGRIMEGRRYSEGLHQALEAKEHVQVREENQTLATITLQNYFRLYEKLSGMTGTAMTEDAEFRQIYKLPVVAIPPNRPVQRVDENDLIYRNIDAKYRAVADHIKERNAKGQPCLIGTVSIENSEKLSRLLSKRGIKHETLNAKNHEREAAIVAQAGRVGAVTIATNMAGRGTDILLGGNPEFMVNDVLIDWGIDPQEANEEQRDRALSYTRELTKREHDIVKSVGGLCVIGTERHESRRIDNQLRGRAGRQGDPGATQFYLSLEDDLMRLFGGSRMDAIGNMMDRQNMPEDMPIQAKMVSKAIESAQRQVEAMHFAARKNVLEYDDVMNLQRNAIYSERNAILDGKDISDKIPQIIRDVVDTAIADMCPDKNSSEDWDFKVLNLWVANMANNDSFDCEQVDHDDDADELADAIIDYLQDIYNKKRESLGDEAMSAIESQVMLRVIDSRWMAHLQDMDYLKTGIGLRAFGQRDPLTEYREEAHVEFGYMTQALYEDFLRTVLHLELAVPNNEDEQSVYGSNLSYSSPEDILTDSSSTATKVRNIAGQAEGRPQVPETLGKTETFVKNSDDPYAHVGRNDLCPCGSGKKYKHCHGFDAS